MENKKKMIILSLVAIGLFVIVAVIFMYEPVQNKLVDKYKKTTEHDYEKLQNQFAVDFPCGITEFDSPYVKAKQCEPLKMEKGTPMAVAFSGFVGDTEGKALTGVRIKINNGEEIYTEPDGTFNLMIEVNSVQKSINVVGDKFGYSPIRDVLNAEVENDTIVEIGEYEKNFTMREIEVQDVVLDSENEITIISKKYPKVSLTIPAGGLENIKGEIVTGKVTGEIIYLDPNNPEDAKITPGFSGNTKQMIGIDKNGDQVVLTSGGMTFFYLKETGSDEILQPREGVAVKLTQPILDNFNDTNNYVLEEEEMSEELRASLLLDMKKETWGHWYYNQRTGLWEEWFGPGEFTIDEENGTYTIEMARFSK